METFSTLIQSIDQLFQDYKFARQAVLPALASITAQQQEKTIHMESQAWTHTQFQYVRQTHLVNPGRIHMLNLTIYPHPDFDLPLFALDIVIMADKLRVAVVDAMPLFRDESVYSSHWLEPFKGLYEQSIQLAPPYERKLDWSFKYLGPYACLIRDLERVDFPKLFELSLDYLKLYLSIAQQTPAIPTSDTIRKEAVRKWHTDYNQKHLQVELQRNPLLHYFGQELGEQYLRQFLFCT